MVPAADSSVSRPRAGGAGEDAIAKLSIDTIRGLAMDAVQKANAGHPGTAMALAPLAYTLFKRFLRFNPQDPAWPNRDRFVLFGPNIVGSFGRNDGEGACPEYLTLRRVERVAQTKAETATEHSSHLRERMRMGRVLAVWRQLDAKDGNLSLRRIAVQKGPFGVRNDWAIGPGHLIRGHEDGFICGG